MLGFKGPMSDCPIEQECLAWAHKYLKDCVCDVRDEISLALGLASVFSWGVAEVPQIITNFKEKTTEGVSLAFLMTWVVGDVLNLAGCYLEPATLPTQFYMAVQYTLTTIILVAQTVYYDYLYLYFHPAEDDAQKPSRPDVEAQKPIPIKATSASAPDSASTPLASSINVPHGRRSSRRDVYYTSARSLASSYTPIVGSYLVGSRESEEQSQGFLRPSQEQPSHGSISHAGSFSSNSAGGSFARTAAASILLVGTVGVTSSILSGGAQAGGQVLLRTGRSLLQASGSRSGFFLPLPRRTYYIGEAQSDGPWGEVFGWCMAAIYVSGRLPQILLNMKRGTVEGLNPLMFVFALVGNAAYVASILVRTLEWAMIKPNMPWLVDAGVCVCLDSFIICQFMYYAFKVKEVVGADEEGKTGNYEAIR